MSGWVCLHLTADIGGSGGSSQVLNQQRPSNRAQTTDLSSRVSMHTMWRTQHRLTAWCREQEDNLCRAFRSCGMTYPCPDSGFARYRCRVWLDVGDLVGPRHVVGLSGRRDNDRSFAQCFNSGGGDSPRTTQRARCRSLRLCTEHCCAATQTLERHGKFRSDLGCKCPSREHDSRRLRAACKTCLAKNSNACLTFFVLCASCCGFFQVHR